MATKANHHYVPQFYLRGFAEGAGRQAKIFAFDAEQKNSFTTLVRNVGSKRHFFRIEVDGHDPNTLEDAMAEIEGEISAHLIDVIAAKSFPTAEHFNSIMNLVATLSVRNPRLRSNMEDFHKRVVDATMNIALSREEIWNSQTEKMREAGHQINDNLSYGDMKSFFEQKNFDVVIDQTHLILLELRMIEPVLQAAARRNWCFVSAPEGTQYICCDDPVVLTWKDIKKRSGFYSPGHGLADTRVIFPLCSNLLLVGEFEELPKNVLHPADQVVAANSEIARHSTRQIYARDGSFEIYAHGTRVKGIDLARHFARRK